jgi:hypothetical protein
VDIKIKHGSSPAAGFAAEAPVVNSSPHPVAQARANQRKSEELLPAMPSAGLCSLHWEEALTVASLRIRRITSYGAIALCSCEDDLVRVKFAGGEDRSELEALTVRQGEGLIGWVAEVGKPILNGNPAVEPGYAKRDGAPGLLSALALPCSIPDAWPAYLRCTTEKETPLPPTNWSHCWNCTRPSRLSYLTKIR